MLCSFVLPVSEPRLGDLPAETHLKTPTDLAEHLAWLGKSGEGWWWPVDAKLFTFFKANPFGGKDVNPSWLILGKASPARLVFPIFSKTAVLAVQRAV